MKFPLILAGAVLACALPVGLVQAAPQGTLLVADNNDHKDDHKGTPQGGGTPSHGTMSGPTHGTNTMGGPSHGTNTMGTQNRMNTQMFMGTQQTGGGNTSGTQRNRHVNTQVHVNGMTGTGTTNRNFDRRSFQRNVTATRQFHISHYSRPHGWYAHRWVYGEILPALFWSQQYWISDYYDYGLPDPPPGFIWVRDGDDALLVDQNTGEVLQADYDLFD